MQALVLAGGSGTRFWPLSRRSLPKQLLALEGERSLLRTTVDRLRPLVEPSAVWVCTTRALADAVRRQLPDVPPEQVLAEPEGRNTAPAIAWSLKRMSEGGDEVVAVLPADHRMGDDEAFRRALGAALESARAHDRVLTLGVRPRWPETGYGYLELGEEISGEPGLRRVRRFVEKPDEETAQRYFDGGDHLWNAGIFVFRAHRMLDEIERVAPEIAAGLARIAAEPERLDEIYPTLPSISIDFAVMEKIGELATLALDCRWSDLGSWAALAEVLPADGQGNAVRGDVVSVDAAGNLLYAADGTIAALGVRDLVVVRTGDVVLVLPKERSQEVRRLVSELEGRGREGLL